MSSVPSAEYFDPELRAAVTRIARVPLLLVACDYDGTLAPIVQDPTEAVPLPEAVAAVRTLASLPQTTVAVVSGRALRDLAALSRLPSEVHLVGSHGSEFDVGFVQRLAPELVDLHARLHTELKAIIGRHPGVRLETKPASIAMHTRGVDPDIAAGAVAEREPPPGYPIVRIGTIVEHHPGVHAHHRPTPRPRLGLHGDALHHETRGGAHTG